MIQELGFQKAGGRITGFQDTGGMAHRVPGYLSLSGYRVRIQQVRLQGFRIQEDNYKVRFDSRNKIEERETTGINRKL